MTSAENNLSESMHLLVGHADPLNAKNDHIHAEALIVVDDLLRHDFGDPKRNRPSASSSKGKFRSLSPSGIDLS